MSQAEIAGGAVTPPNELPSKGRRLRDFGLLSTLGRKIWLSEYRGRSNLVVVVADDRTETTTLLRSLASQYTKFKAEESEVLAIVSLSPQHASEMSQRLGIPFPILIDEESRIHSEFGAVDDARLQAGEDFRRRRGLRRGAEPAIDLAAKPERADFQPAEIAETLELVAEPAAHADAGVAAHERLDAERRVELVPQRLAAAGLAAARLADPDAFRVISVGAERARAPGADPLRPSRVPLALLGKPLPEGLHQLVEPAQRLDPGLVVVAQVTLELLA